MIIISINCTIFTEEATSTLAGFHAGHLSWSNWNLKMLVFQERRKPENSETWPLEKELKRRESTTNLSNPGLIGGRQVISTLLHPCSPEGGFNLQATEVWKKKENISNEPITQIVQTSATIMWKCKFCGCHLWINSHFMIKNITIHRFRRPARSSLVL